jgi:hypothetical protein
MFPLTTPKEGSKDKVLEVEELHNSQCSGIHVEFRFIATDQ